jgi:hypothetical protein
MGLQLELGRFPVVVCRLTANELAADLERECASYIAELARHRGLFACAHDWSAATELGADTWRLVFESAVLSSALASRCVGQAIVVSTPALRGFATSISMQQRMPYPVRVAASLDAALSWCTWQLRRSEPQAV